MQDHTDQPTEQEERREGFDLVAASGLVEFGERSIFIAGDDPEVIREFAKKHGFKFSGYLRTVGITLGNVIEEGPTVEEFAKLFHGRPYGSEVKPEEELAMRQARMVAIFGASDDLMEFRGFIHDEEGAPGMRRITHKGKILSDEDWEGAKKLFEDGIIPAMPEVIEVEAIWNDASDTLPCWLIRTGWPHAEFTIVETGTPFCTGIVIQLPEV